MNNTSPFKNNAYYRFEKGDLIIMGYSGNIDEMAAVEEKSIAISRLVSHEANLISCSINWPVY